MARYFVDDEFRCSCCGALPDGGMDGLLVSILDVLRHKLNTPLVITSGYRCEECNKLCGGVENSQHRFGSAADVLVPDGVNLDYMADVARSLGADGIGRYYDGGFVHIDTRGYIADW